MTSIMLAVGFLVFSFATLVVAVITDSRRRDEWGDPLDSWEAEQRRRRASVHGTAEDDVETRK